MTRVEEEGEEDERAERERRYLLRVGGPLGGLQKWLARLLVSPSVKKSKSKLAPSLAVWSPSTSSLTGAHN